MLVPGTLTNSTTNLNQQRISTCIAEIRRGSFLETSNTQRIAGDGSGRQFFRLSQTGKRSEILMVLPEDDQLALQRQEHPWVMLCEKLRHMNIRTPHIYDVLPECAALVIEDCGDTTLAEEIFQNPDNIKRLYSQAAQLCAHINETSISTPHPNFTSETFMKELLFFHNHANLSVTLHQFKRDAQNLCRQMMDSPQVLTHRDFHSRNIMVTDQDWILIDFQDARTGPLAYDLVSLCFDPYIPQDFEQRMATLHSGSQNFQLKHQLIASWKPNAIQRLLKAIGSFFYLTSLGRGDYMSYVPIACETLEKIGLRQWPALEQAVREVASCKSR